MTVAILGYGTAGVNAAIALRNAGYDGEIEAFVDKTFSPGEGQPAMPYSPIMTSYYAGGLKTRKECFPWDADLLEQLRVTFVAEGPVTSLDVADKRVVTAAGSHGFEKCIICTGATPQTFGFPADCGYEPLVLRTMEDAERMKAAFEAPDCKRVLVSGASMVALKTLEAALSLGRDVTLVGMNPHVLDFNAFPETATRFERGLESFGATLRLGMTIQDVEVANAAEGKLRVTFSNGDVDFFDAISVAHGMKCNLDFVEKGSLDIDRALLVDDFMRTSNPDIYAAGDVAQALELISGERRIVGIWKTAALQGEVAGRAIAAELAGKAPSADFAYRGAIATNTIQVRDLLFTSAGTMLQDENTELDVTETDEMTTALLYRDIPGRGKTLVGFNIVEDASKEGDKAFDLGAMLTMRIEASFK